MVVVELSEEEKQQVMMTEEFKRFIDRTSRIMERAVTQEVDIFVDYTGEHQDGDGSVKQIVLLVEFQCESCDSISDAYFSF